VCEVLGFPTNAVEVSVFLGYDTALLGNWFSQVRDKTLISVSEV
jgi:hypothetical protein